MCPDNSIRAIRSHARRSRLLTSPILTALLLPAGCATAFAQQPASSAVDLPTIDVLSATGVATPDSQIASSVTVVTSAEMQRDQRRTVPDALATVPGLNIVQTGGPGGTTSVFMRGTNSNQTKILIDGIDVSDPSNPNRLFDLGQLLTADLDRIEVLRGPQSGLYGADAIGGVIAIYTKKGEGPPKATGMVEMGSFGTRDQSASLSGSQDRFNYTFNVAHFQSTDTPVTPLNLLPPGQRRNNDAYDNFTYSTRLGADVTDNFSVNYIARYTDARLMFTGDVFDPNTFADVPSPNQSTTLVHQFFTRGEGVWSLFDNRVKNIFGVNYSNQWNWNQDPDTIPTISVNKGDRTKFDWRSITTVLPGHTLVMGLEQDTERLRTDAVSAQNGNKAAYAEWQSEFEKRFFLVANLRGDDNDSFGSHTTYRVAPAMIVPVTDTKLKGSYGTGFKAPTLNQLFVDFPAFNFFANPNLKPEESVGYDIGFEQPIENDRFRFGLTYFHNDITNLINTFFDPVNLRSTLINVDDATTQGVETFASVVVSQQLKLRGDYTYTKAINTITGLELLRRPRDKASLSAIFTPIEKLQISSTLLFVGNWEDVDRSTFAAVTQQGYTIVNIAANYTFHENMTAFARVDNLFNRHYEDPNGFLRPGVGIYGGVRMATR